MPFVEEIVSLTVDGTRLQGWQEVAVDRSAGSAEISFNLSAANPSWSAQAKTLRQGKAVEIRTSPAGRGAGDLMVAGHVAGYKADYDDDSKSVVLDGKSKAADAIDCHPIKHKTGRFENKTLLEIAKELDEVGCGFKTDQQLTKLVKVQRQPLDTIYETIEREARKQGLMLQGEPDGSINITRAGSKRHAGALVCGQSPVKKMGVAIKCDAKFSKIVARGQRATGTGADALRLEESETDPSVGRYRPLLILPEGDWSKKELKQRLQWERLRRAGNGVTITATVSTWRDEAGKLWTPGLLMAIVHEPEDVDGDFSLSSVSFRQGKEGTAAFLTFVDPKAQGGKGTTKGTRGKAKGNDAVFDAGDPGDWV